MPVCQENLKCAVWFLRFNSQSHVGWKIDEQQHRVIARMKSRELYVN
jgi:hypothetical protein